MTCITEIFPIYNLKPESLIEICSISIFFLLRLSAALAELSYLMNESRICSPLSYLLLESADFPNNRSVIQVSNVGYHYKLLNSNLFFEG